MYTLPHGISYKPPPRNVPLQASMTVTDGAPYSGDNDASNIWDKPWLYMRLRMANPLYVQILKNGPFTPMERVEESTDEVMVILAHYCNTPKSGVGDPGCHEFHFP
ncbi:hypothetical protein AgCh_039273 [Apium graveolens]